MISDNHDKVVGIIYNSNDNNFNINNFLYLLSSLYILQGMLELQGEDIQHLKRLISSLLSNSNTTISSSNSKSSSVSTVDSFMRTIDELKKVSL